MGGGQGRQLGIDGAAPEFQVSFDGSLVQGFGRTWQAHGAAGPSLFGRQPASQFFEKSGAVGIAMHHQDGKPIPPGTNHKVFTAGTDAGLGPVLRLFPAAAAAMNDAGVEPIAQQANDHQRQDEPKPIHGAGTAGRAAADQRSRMRTATCWRS